MQRLDLRIIATVESEGADFARSIRASSTASCSTRPARTPASCAAASRRAGGSPTPPWPSCAAPAARAARSRPPLPAAPAARWFTARAASSRRRTREFVAAALRGRAGLPPRSQGKFLPAPMAATACSWRESSSGQLPLSPTQGLHPRLRLPDEQARRRACALARSARAGYEEAATPEEADVVLYNTCSVRAHAEERVYSNVGKLKSLKRRKPGLIIGILGCMAQKDAREDLRAAAARGPRLRHARIPAHRRARSRRRAARTASWRAAKTRRSRRRAIFRVRPDRRQRVPRHHARLRQLLRLLRGPLRPRP